MSEHLRFSWRLFWILFVAAIVGILAIVPSGIELLKPFLEKVGPPPFPYPLVFLLGAVQNLVLLSLFIIVGIRLSARVGLGAELTQAWLDGELERGRVTRVVGFSVGSGLLVALVLLPCLFWLARDFPTLPFVAISRVAIWKRVLMCFYGGLYEEIFARLFLLGLIAWFLSKGWRTGSRLTTTKFWIANIIVGILFGLGHLPSTSMMMPITPVIVIAALALNGIAALTFGWLYRIRGLEAAMIAHFTVDLMLWVVGPALL